MMHAVAFATSAVVVVVTGCFPCESGSGRSLRRDFVGSGSVSLGGVAAADCIGTSGALVPGEGGAGESCRWDLAASGSWAAGVDDDRPTSGELPTWVWVHTPRADVLFALPDLRRQTPGTRALTLPVGAWTPDAVEIPDPSVAGACVAGGPCFAGKELALTVDVVERTGSAKTSGGWLATDDFRANARVTGTVTPADPSAPLSFELRVIQTYRDYPVFTRECL